MKLSVYVYHTHTHTHAGLKGLQLSYTIEKILYVPICRVILYLQHFLSQVDLVSQGITSVLLFLRSLAIVLV